MKAALSTPVPVELQKLFAASPFHQALGCTLEPLPAGHANATGICVRLPFNPICERENGSARIHGGVIAALVDLTGAFAAMAAGGRNVPSTSAHITYLRPAKAAELVAVGRVRRLGRTIGVVDVEISQNEELVALGRVSVNMK